MALQDGAPPKSVHLSFDNLPKLSGEFGRAVIRGFLKKWRCGELNEADTRRVAELIKGNLLRTFDKLGEDIALYEFATENGIITKQNVRKLLERIESAECRAMLLEYSRRTSKRVDRHGVLFGKGINEA